MKNLISQNLKNLADALPCPLYLTGGLVRNYILGFGGGDYDISAPLDYGDFISYAEKAGFEICSVYKRTRTLKIKYKNEEYEFSSFRTELYNGGHTPFETNFTKDITSDAKRRDFKCNAIYYDIKQNKIVDPLNGVSDIKNKIISTVIEPDKVFCNDGLRLMRLVRFAGELNFTTDESTLNSAKKYSYLIKDISPERIFSELKQILTADIKYGNKYGQYKALKILSETGILGKIIPELTLGDNMPQRKDFHDHDVLEHSLRAVKYSQPDVRLAALFHDIGKPYCFKQNGNFHGHDKEGGIIAEKVLKRLKASNNEIKQVVALTTLHMYDLDLKTNPNKIKKFIVKNYKYFDELLLIKQADFSACKDNLCICDTVIKWKRIYAEMKSKNTPFTLKELKINGNDLIEIGIKNKEIKQVLNNLLNICVLNPEKNKKDILLKLALGEQKH